MGRFYHLFTVMMKRMRRFPTRPAVTRVKKKKKNYRLRLRNAKVWSRKYVSMMVARVKQMKKNHLLAK